MGEKRRKRLHGGKVSLTAFEAEWLYLVADTCSEIAADTFEHVKARPAPSDVYDAWEKVVSKLANICPDEDRS